jgi:integrase
MRRPDRVSVYDLTKRSDRPRRPWLVRWQVNGVERSRSFAAKAAADDFHSRLRVAARDGQTFDPHTLEPVVWQNSTQRFVDAAEAWVERQAPTWAPRSRRSAVEALVRAVLLAVSSRAPEPPASVRRHLTARLTPGWQSQDRAAEAWLRRWSLPLSQLTPAVASSVHAGLGLKEDGVAAAPTTTRRLRSTTHALIKDLVADGQLAADPWPATKKARRRADKVSHAVDVELLPSPDQALALIDAVASRQPGSRGYRLLSLVCWYAGLRPSEARALRVEDLDLPETGWGSVRVSRSEDGEGGEGSTKTGRVRRVPLAPPLVAELRTWLGERTTGLLVESRSGQMVSLSNWRRALVRACDQTAVAAISPYDLRHCCATMMLDAGVAPGEAARRLGHSVEVLMRTYAGVMVGDEASANARIDAVLTARGL